MHVNIECAIQKRINIDNVVGIGIDVAVAIVAIVGVDIAHSRMSPMRAPITPAAAADGADIIISSHHTYMLRSVTAQPPSSVANRMCSRRDERNRKWLAGLDTSCRRSHQQYRRTTAHTRGIQAAQHHERRDIGTTTHSGR